MPYPTQVTYDSVVEKARAMIEAEGVEHLSLHKLAAALGVKAPSLYRYFDSKSALLRAVNTVTSQQLVEALRAAAAVAPAEPAARWLAIAQAYWMFAHQYPATYGLAFTNTLTELRPDENASETLALPLQALMAQVVGESESLPALRGAWALIHGFVMLELSGQFRRGGDLDAAFEKSVQAYIAGWRHGE